MTVVPARRIFKSASNCATEVRELLQAVFVGELLAPGRCLWLVSPWISDIGVIDHRTGAFTALEPSWPRRHIRLAEVLARLLVLRTAVVVATRPDEHNNAFLRRLEDLVAGGPAAGRLTVHRLAELHLKGILGDGFHLSGSMNLTHQGVLVLEEGILFDRDPASVAETRLAFLERYGGVR